MRELLKLGGSLFAKTAVIFDTGAVLLLLSYAVSGSTAACSLDLHRYTALRVEDIR